LPALRIGGHPAEVKYGGFVSAGVYQLNVEVPAGLPSGDVPLSLSGAAREAVLEIR
jgi:uncharacterized protein (TIGR03437 family)